MPNVFISYRRDDSAAFAGRLFDRLRDHFGKDHVFRDVDTLAPGAEFAKIIRERIATCDALVAIIGRNWLTIKDDNGRPRLDDPADLVKAEIREALDGNKLVIPALVDGARMPRSEDLSDQIAGLAARNAIEISESRFDYDANRLIEAVRSVTGDGDAVAGDGGKPAGAISGAGVKNDARGKPVMIAAVVGAVAIAGGIGYAVLHGRDPGRSIGAHATNSVVAGGNVVATAAAGGTAIVAGGSVTVGITLEQYEAGLKRREQEIRAEIARSGQGAAVQLPASGSADASGSANPLVTAQKELLDIHAKSQNLEKSLEEYKAMLADASATLEKLQRDVPTDELQEARRTLNNGDTAAAEALFEKTLATGKEQAAESAYQLGKLAYGKVDYRKAYEHYLGAIPLQPDNPVYLNAAGRVALDLGKQAEAQEYLEKALAIRRKSPGTAPRDLATSLNNLAALYQAQGRYSRAEPLYKEALDLRRKTGGVDPSDLASALNNLAELYRAQGQFAKAEPLYLEGLAIQKNPPGGDSHALATSLNNLALLYKSQGAYEKAEAMYREALATTETTLGPSHPDFATTLGNLAALYQTEGQLDKAAPLYEKALAIQKKSLGPDHPGVATTLNNLAGLYQKQRRFDKAEPLYADALAIQKKALGAGHPAVAMTLNNTALLFKTQGQYAKAEPLYREALTIFQDKLRPDDPNLATVMENYAVCLAKLGRTNDAALWQDHADAIRRQAASAVSKAR